MFLANSNVRSLGFAIKVDAPNAIFLGAFANVFNRFLLTTLSDAFAPKCLLQKSSSIPAPVPSSDILGVALIAPAVAPDNAASFPRAFATAPNPFPAAVAMY